MTDQRIIASWHDSAAAGRYRAQGLWGDQGLSQIFDSHAAADPGKLAVADARVRLRYDELAEQTRRIARVLLDLGVRPGDPVGVQVPSCALLPLVHLACVRIGALFVPMSAAWRRIEVGSLLGAIRAPVLISVAADGDVDLREMHSALRGELPALRHVIYAREDGPDSLESRAAAADPLSPEAEAALRRGPDEPAHVMVSSGTTGVPKASVWSGNNVAVALLHHTAPSLSTSADDVAAGLASASLGSTGYIFPVLLPLLTGATSIMLEDWSPTAALELMAANRCTFATAIPTQMIMLLQLPVADYDLSRLARFNNAGAPLPPDVAEQIETQLGCRVQTIYGATDGGIPVMTNVDDPDGKRRTTVGRVLPGEELELRGADGAPAGAGEPGEVCWRGANKSYGYLNQPEYDAIAWDDAGWFRSGDLGVLDEDGYLRIVGRSKDMILRGGMNIFPRDVETVLIRHPGITDVALVGVPDDRLGERACAVIVAAARPPALADLIAFCAAEGMAKFKYPEFLVAIDAMPVNAGGKLDRARVRAQALQRLGLNNATISGEDS